MSSVVDLLTDVIKGIGNISSEIIKGIGDLFLTLWEWLGNIFSAIGEIAIDVVDGIGSLFDILHDWLIELFETLRLWLVDIYNSILDLPSFILTGIYGIFVPDTEQIKLNFDDMLESVSNSFGISFDSLEEFTDTWQEKPADDIEADYTISGVGTLKLKFLDTTYLIQGVNKFRPIIRGFVVLLLILYNYYQVLTFIGQDPRISHNAEQTAEKHLSRKEK